MTPPPAHPFAWAQNEPLGFAEFGLDRQLPEWIDPAWSMPVIHLGPGRKKIPQTVEYDWPTYNFDDFKTDLMRDTLSDYLWELAVEQEEESEHRTFLPHRKESVGGVIATHVLEHLSDPRPLLREVSRVLAPGCPFNILVPHGQSLMFLQDLDHRSAFVTETWKTLIKNGYYEKEHDGFAFEIGANFLFGITEANVALVTQLIKI